MSVVAIWTVMHCKHVYIYIQQNKLFKNSNRLSYPSIKWRIDYQNICQLQLKKQYSKHICNSFYLILRRQQRLRYIYYSAATSLIKIYPLISVENLDSSITTNLRGELGFIKHHQTKSHFGSQIVFSWHCSCLMWKYTLMEVVRK